MAIQMVRDLRQKMESTASFAGMQLQHVVKLSDGMVLSWALALANMVMNPRCALIDRTKFLENLDRELVKRFIELNEATDDERRAMLELLVAGSSEFSAFDTSAPLRASPPEGRVS